ncbi:carotenoid oxygenase [Massariosphaeria phaeospora]|uniref:Carotenoid oxygenase n=1 Tax=Massariosphaeria phaeospora TaxID=100035 RepID=A0A7C8M7W2_9PLEO|nr:carotenoid oxygenase [Massariosphaeria phaeospora]
MVHSIVSLSVSLFAYRALAELGSPPEGTPPLAYGFYSSPETLEPTELEIVGTIPHWLSGSLYRGAQAGWDAGNYTSGHWFDGFSRNHRFEIAGGKVTYRSRNASNEVTDFIRETGFFPGSSFGGDPCKAIFGEFEVTFRDGRNPVGDKSTDSIAISYIKNFPGLDPNSTNFGPMITLVSTTDAEGLQQIDPVTLEPIEMFTYGASGIENGSARSSAHPAIGKNGEVYNYLLDDEGYRVFAIENGVGRVLATITDAPAAYIHSLSSTEHYLILIVWQADLKLEARNLVDQIAPWDPDRDALFYIIPKAKGGVIAKYTAPTFFAFHETNSFETDNDIVIDLPVYDNAEWLNATRMPYLRDNVGRQNKSQDFDISGRHRRFRLKDYLHQNQTSGNGTLPSKEATVDFTMPLEANIELPKINDVYHGRPYRYVYGEHSSKPGFFTDSIIKIDTISQDFMVWVPETNHVPSEPMFVARSGSSSEDDGVLLVVALDEATKLSSLIVLDAKEMVEIGRARLPVVVGYGFHGIWGGA